MISFTTHKFYLKNNAICCEIKRDPQGKLSTAWKIVDEETGVEKESTPGCEL